MKTLKPDTKTLFERSIGQKLESERIDRESQRFIAMGRDLERQDVIAHVRFKLKKFKNFKQIYQTGSEVVAELKRIETWLEKRFKKK